MNLINGSERPADTSNIASSVEDLCRTHMALVHHEVRSISARLPGHVNHDDLVSAGMSALFAAATSFLPEYGVPFGRFAVRRIKGALLDELRSSDWATRSLRVRMRTRNAAHEGLAVKLGRTPSPAEVAAEMGVPVHELERLEADLHQSVVLRLDHLGPDTATETLLPSAGPTPETVIVERERQAYLRDAVEVLPERLRVVVLGCFFEDRPMRELAEQLGVSESRISQMRAEALRLLHDGLDSQFRPKEPVVTEEPSLPQRRAGVAAGRREAYYALIASRSSYRARLSMPTAPHRAELPVEISA